VSINDSLLSVVCTDRGTHPQRVLARLSIGVKDGRVAITRMGRTHLHADDGRFVAPPSTNGTADARKRDDGGVTFAFTCPSCQRNVPLRDDRLAILAGLTEDDAARIAAEPESAWVARWDVSSLDISHLRT
jgi:hypothetical protein